MIDSSVSSSIQTDRKVNRLASKNRFITILFFLILGSVTFLCYSNTFNAPFYYDDFFNIVDDPHIRLTHLDWESISNFALSSGTRKINRPVSTFTFALNYYFGQYNVFGYHLLNIIIHIISGFFLFIFLKKTLHLNWQPESRSPFKTVSPDSVAFFAALIWLVHPLNIQSVTYLVQRMNAMASMFFLLSMVCYINGRIIQRKLSMAKNQKAISSFLWFSGCAISGFLAITSKQNSVTLPVFIFIYEWFFFQNLSKDWILQKLKPIAILLLLFTGVLLYLNDGTSLEKIFYRYDPNVFTLSQRLHTELRVVVFYITLIFYPHPNRLNLDHGFPLSDHLLAPPTTLIAMVALLSLFFLSIYSAPGKRLVSFCVLWFLGNLFIESSFIGLDIIYEHRNYLPSMMICFLSVLLLSWFINQKKLLLLSIFGMTVLFSFWTYQRNMIWNDPIAFWTDCVKKAPVNARPGINLGLEYLHQGDADKAIHQFKAVAQLNPRSPKVASNLYFNWGEALAQQEKVNEAIAKYDKSIDILPYNDYVHISKAMALIKLNELDAAVVHLTQAIKLNIYNAKAYFLLGLVSARQGQTNDAISLYLEAIKFDPHFIEARSNLGNLYAQKGMNNEAIKAYREALKLQPDHVMTMINLGNMMAAENKFENAVDNYMKALEIDPSNAEADKNLGKVFLKMNDLSRSENFLKKSLKLDPEDPEIYNTLGIVLSQQHRFKEAIDCFEQALKIKPGYANAHENLEQVRSLSQRSTSIDDIRKTLIKEPDNPELHYQAGYIYQSKHMFDKAIREYQAALTLAPEYFDALYRLALVHAAKTEYDQAISLFYKLINLEPANSKIYYNIACLYSLQNEKGQALEWLKKAVNKGYNNWDQIKNDPDLKSIRNTPDYLKLINFHQQIE